MQIKKVTQYLSDAGFTFTFEPVEDSVKIVETTDGYEARYIVQDSDAASPDGDKDDGSLLVHYHQDMTVSRDDIITEDDLQEWYDEKKIQQEKLYWIFEVSAYIHSGVTLYLGYRQPCQWDTSHVGAVLVAKTEARTRKKAEVLASGLIETWNQYLSGDVYGVVIERYDMNKVSRDNVDSCWGYYGRKYALEEAHNR